MKEAPVSARTTTINGHSWRRWRGFAFADLDWSDVVVDPGGTIFGPGPYLKVAYSGNDPDWQWTRHRVRPLVPGRADFECRSGVWWVVPHG